MDLIIAMQAEAIVRMDRKKWIAARMSELLTALYGQNICTHETLCDEVYHRAAGEWEQINRGVKTA
jgi:hypothetical protein